MCCDQKFKINSKMDGFALENYYFFLAFRRVWQTTVDLPVDTEIKYRYAVCSFPKAINSDRKERVIIHKWESSVCPRELITQGEY